MIGCKKTKLKTSGIKILGQIDVFLAFLLEMAFWPNLKWLLGQIWLFETIHLLTREFYQNNASFK